jgi:tetratricopeptide (TPR) repeat protein
MDFGVAKLVRNQHPGGKATGGGVIIGTPAYMAPEQRAAMPLLDHKVDIYAWGVLAAETLTGRSPRDIQAGPTELGDAPAAVVALVAQCLAKDPAARPADADALLRGLDAVAPPRHAPWKVVGLATAAAALALIIGFTARKPVASSTLLGVPLAVAPLQNETGDSTLSAWGRMAGDWLTQALQESGLAPVISWHAALDASTLAGDEPDKNLVTRLNRKTGARSVVTGAYYLVGDSLQFRAQVSNAESGEVLTVVAPVITSRATPQGAFPLLRERVLGAVAVLADEAIPAGGGMRQRPPTYDAWRVFEQASLRFQQQDYAGSIPLFQRSHELDTTFMVPLLTLVSALWNEAEYDSIGPVLAVLRQHDAVLSPYQQLQVEEYEALLRSDIHQAYDALTRAAKLVPDSRAGYNVALLALSLDRPDEALASLESLEPERGALGSWSSYWSQLAHALHLLGEHGREREAARTLTRRFPDRRVGLTLEVRALAAQGDTAEIDRLLAAAEPLPASTYWSQGAAMVTAGEELMAHGHVAAGELYLQRAATWLEAQLQLDPAQRGHRYWLGSAYYSLGRWKDASGVFDALERDFPDRREYHSLAVISRARVEGRSTVAELGEPRPWGRGSNAFQRGRIAAATGDLARARALFTEAVGIGIEGLPWLHATSVRDLLDFGPEVNRLPPGLRIVPAGSAPLPGR